MDEEQFGHKVKQIFDDLNRSDAKDSNLKRENGNMKKADDMKRSCLENGWIPVSMRDDWNVIYKGMKGKQ